MANDDPKRAATESAATRRRWINLAEIVGVAGLLIAGLALWSSYQERTAAETDKTEARKQALAQAQALILRGTPDREGERLSLAPADSEQTIQSQTIAFPTPLSAAPVETIADPRIEAIWFRRELLRAIADRGGDSGEGDADRRVPIVITTRFYSGGALFTDNAVYDVVYRLEGGGLFEGRKIRLRGISRLSLEGISDRAIAKTRADSLWKQRTPATRPGT